MKETAMTPEEDPIPPELEHLYDTDEVFHLDCTPEKLAGAVLRTRE